MKLQIEPCHPPLWARGGHHQTLIAYALPSPRIKQTFNGVCVPLPDGDQLYGRYYPGTSSSLIVIFHGLIGSADSSYMHRLALRCFKQNHSVILMNHRGCGEGDGFAKGTYHSGRGDDISEVISYCRKKFPQKQIIAMGFSLSANALLTLLTGLRGEHLPDQAIAVNGPSDLAACAESLKTGFNRLYDLWFVNGCRKEIESRQKKNFISKDLTVSRLAYLQDVDELYTAPYGGFNSAADYYAKCSSAPHLKKIKTPTFILMSKDDPFIPWQPYLSAKENPNVYLHLEDTGGHMGYLCQTMGPLGYRRWMDDTLDDVLRQMTH
ncbi:alpha/beta fold hydrolase [bacterium]|nr:alpha/beta fold hydrolase [bacterium]